MAEEFYEEVRNWVQGSVTAVDPDHGPLSWLSGAKNVQLIRHGQGTSAVGTRPCIRTTMKGLRNGGEILHEIVHMQPYAWAPTDQTAFTQYLACVDAQGKIMYKLPNDGTDANLVQATIPTSGVWFTQYGHFDSTVMNNRLFIINSAGEHKSIKNIYEVPFGSRTPDAITVSTTTTPVTGQAIVLPAGDYTVGITYYHPDTGAESEMSAEFNVTTNGSELISIAQTFPSAVTAGEMQYSHFRVYVRRDSTQALLYMAPVVLGSTGGNFAGEAGAVLKGAANPVYLNMSAAELADNIIPAPFAGENARAPKSALYATAYGRRMLMADRRKIYWSKLDLPDAFPAANYESIDTGEGDEITGLFPHGDDMLVIFTRSFTYALVGNDPQTWQLRPLDTTTGCVGHKSVIEFDGKLAWWSPQNGPVVLEGGQINKLAQESLGQQLWLDGPELMNRVKGGWDPVHEHIQWSLPADADANQYSRTFVYNYRAGAWVGEWDVLPVGAYATAFNQRGEQRLFVGDRSCNVGYFDSKVARDGDLGGTVRGTFTAGASSITTITDGAATFYTEVGGTPPETASLKDRLVVIVNSAGTVVASERITSNTATVLTLNRAVSVTNGQTYTYVIGAPVVEIPTRWFDAGRAFRRKRYDRLYAQVTSTDTTYPVYVEQQKNQDTTSTVSVGTVTPVGVAATTDSTWNVPVLIGDARKFKRLNVFKNAQQMRFVFRQHEAVPMVVVKIGVSGRVLSDRYLS